MELHDVGGLLNTPSTTLANLREVKGESTDSSSTYVARRRDTSTRRQDRTDTDREAVAAVIERARHDPSAFAGLYDDYFPCIYRYVAARLESTAAVEDAVSDTFVRAIDSLPRFEYRGPGSFGAWLVRIAHNRVLDELVKSNKGVGVLNPESINDSLTPRLPIDESPDESPGASLERAEEDRLMRALIQSLPSRRRQVILLKFFSGLRNRDIADVLGLDEHTVASHLCRALAALRTKYLEASK
jgi:RNA polymerase sigma-70 factor (ECF subfamily)